MARTGRRPGDSGTREAILDAARGLFASEGYRGASIRAIAAEAAVDPALVHHYFGTKRGLFVEVLRFPVGPDLIVDTLIEGDPDDVGERVVRTFLAVWEQPDARDRMRVLVRTAVSDEQAATMLREFIVDAVITPVVARLGTGHAQLRATLVATQMVGLAMVRFVIGVEPLASAPHDLVVATVAPTVQRYLTGDLPA